jgi:HNH endonuclease
VDLGERDRVRERFALRCGYCGVREDGVGATLTIDHHRPRSHGGTDESENLVYACPRCNEHKGAYWHEDDPPYIRLLHPGREDLALHVHEDEDGRLTGVTTEGSFFIEKLRLNRSPLVAYRMRLRAGATRTARLDVAERRVLELEEQIAELRSEVESAGNVIQQRLMRKRS